MDAGVNNLRWEITMHRGGETITHTIYADDHAEIIKRGNVLARICGVSGFEAQSYHLDGRMAVPYFTYNLTPMDV